MYPINLILGYVIHDIKEYERYFLSVYIYTVSKLSPKLAKGTISI